MLNCMHISLFIHATVHGHLFPYLGIDNNAAVLGFQASLQGPLNTVQEVDLLGQINKLKNSTHFIGSWAGVSPFASFQRSIHTHSLVSSMPVIDSVTPSFSSDGL